MGVTAENVVSKWGISREDQDALAVQSHQRAAKATAEGYFKEQILPIELKSRKGTVTFDTDEHIRADATMEGMAKLRPVFDKSGSVTAGNAAGINDAAAAVLCDAETAERKGLEPMGRLVAYAHAGVEPKYMGIGPVPASARCSRRPTSRSTTSTCSRSTRPSRPRPWPWSATQPRGPHQPQRLGGVAGPPDRRHRLHPHRQGPLRAAHRRPPPWSPCASAARASPPSSSAPPEASGAVGEGCGQPGVQFSGG